MRLTIRLFLASLTSLCFATTVTHAINNPHNETLEVWIDSQGNYHVNYDAGEIAPSSESQESYDIDLFRTLMTNRKGDGYTTTKERIHGFIQTAKHFLGESPRSFTLRPRGERVHNDLYGESQPYIFCVYFISNQRSTACISTSYTVNETNITRELNSADINYRIVPEIDITTTNIVYQALI